MFEFEKLIVYQKAEKYHTRVQQIIDLASLKPHQRDQLSRASMSILLNIAEGSGRFTRPAKRNYYTISRGSVFECAAILGVFVKNNIISEGEYQSYYEELEEISKILYSLILKLTD